MLKKMFILLVLAWTPLLCFGLDSTEFNGTFRCVGVIEPSGQVKLDDPLMNQPILTVVLKGFYYEITCKILDDKVHLVALRQDELKEVYVAREEESKDLGHGSLQAVNIGPYLGSTYFLMQSIGDANTKKTYVIEKIEK
jgi:hypothetical protein